MDDERVRILLVEDDRSHAELILRAFEAHSDRMHVSPARTLHEARAALSETAFDLVIADWRLPDGNAGELLTSRPADARYPVIILTGQGDEALAVEALKRGALDSVVKTETTIAQLPRTVERALREWGHIVEQRRAEQMSRNLLESAPDAMVIIDAAGDIVLVNAQTENLFGYSRDELMGKPIEILVPQRHVERHRIERQQYHTNPSSRAMASGLDLTALREDGREVPVEISLSPIRTEGRSFVVAAIRDVTARKRSEQERARLAHELREAQKMEALGTLAGGIAHDFNNVLTAIRGYVEQARASLPHDAPARQPLEMVELASREAGDVTRSLLTFTHRGRTESAPLELRAHLNASLRFFGRLLPAAIEIHNEALAGDPVWVYANVTQIQQILMNLVINARDAMPDGGTLRLMVRREEARQENVSSVNSDEDSATAVLTIEDDGAGMREDVRARVFEPFFTTKTRGQGTGLGLSVVHGIIADLGGRIEVTSKVEAGTRVTIRFPCCSPPDATPDGPETHDGQPDRGGLILLAEDNEFVRSVVATSLASVGYEVIQTADGQEAMKAFDRFRALLRLVILDVDLPGQSGTKCLEQMRSERPELPIVVIAGGVGFEIEEDATQVLLRKPFLASELTRTVVGMLAKAEDLETAS